MICNNCGIKGHISKKCNKPIKSYGVILIHNIQNNPKIIMVNRKDSICYIELVMGKYNINNHTQLISLFERITKEEYIKLNNDLFKNIWMNLWFVDSINNIKEYKKHLGFFIKLKKIIKQYEIYPKYDMTEWEIPKGRKNLNETYLEASIRELEEETNIQKEDYEIITNIKPYRELFVGENLVTYENLYYVGICKHINNIKINKHNRHQIIEVKKVELLNELESINNIRDYNYEKKEVIKKVFEFIKNYNNDLILK